MLQRYVDQIKEADMVLIGIGRELSAKKLIPMDSDEVRNYYKEKNMNVTELINRLELLRKEHGEVEVTVNEDEIIDVDFYDYQNSIDIEGLYGRDLNPDCW